MVLDLRRAGGRRRRRCRRQRCNRRRKSWSRVPAHQELMEPADVAGRSGGLRVRLAVSSRRHRPGSANGHPRRSSQSISGRLLPAR